MTLNEAIMICDRMRPNDFSYSEKEAWVRELEARIEEEVILTHAGGEEIARMRRSDDDDILYAACPHDGMYPAFLLARIDRMTGEGARYNESAAAFNAQYAAFTAWYNRTHMPVEKYIRLKEAQ